jgi:hypothetical protein
LRQIIQLLNRIQILREARRLESATGDASFRVLPSLNSKKTELGLHGKT